MQLTEWLLQRLKIMYGGKIYEGDNPTEAKLVREVWWEVVASLGRKTVMGTVDYLLSGHASVPSYPPSAVEFKKAAKTHVTPYLKYQANLALENKLENTNPEIKNKFMREIRSKLCQIN